MAAGALAAAYVHSGTEISNPVSSSAESCKPLVPQQRPSTASVTSTPAAARAAYPSRSGCRVGLVMLPLRPALRAQSTMRPQLVRSGGLVLERIGCLDHDEGRTGPM